MRPHLAAALCLGLALAHACGHDGFACADDEQCTLAGEPGRCLAEGRCAYPNDECPSGLAYPQGAPAGLAGECVPVEAAGTGGSDEGTAGSSTSGEGTVAGETTAMTGAGDDASSGDPVACQDPYEPNDEPTQASVIPFGEPRLCNTSWAGALDDALDTDWFLLDTSDGACPTLQELAFVTDQPLMLCAVPLCADGSAAELLSCDAELTPLMAGQACCGTTQVRVQAVCADGMPLMVLGVASSTAPADECLPYLAAAFL